VERPGFRFILPAWHHPVVVIATDAAGLVDSCAFTVEVKPGCNQISQSMLTRTRSTTAGIPDSLVPIDYSIDDYNGSVTSR
jgi:hypothetical protein